MIALITPTGAREFQFSLCAYFMSRQTYTGPVAWIIVDDALPRSTNNVGQGFKPNWTIIKTYPAPPWTYGMNTQARNLAAGLDVLLQYYKQEEIEAIFIIEDDDYYKPVYIEKTLPHLQGYWATGEMNTIYYNVIYRTYADNNNRSHSSLFQTVFKPEAIPIFRQSLPVKFIDAHFWMLIKDKGILFNDGTLSVGIKGLPGRRGIGAGHTRMVNHPIDKTGSYINSLIGQEDAKLYERYNGDHGSSQHLLFAKKRL